MMRRSLGSSWRKKIQLEKDLMASLNHPFLVNLSYAFQNTGASRDSAPFAGPTRRRCHAPYC